jgi:RNA polymerase sigma-70 factor (sigma-E family)
MDDAALLAALAPALPRLQRIALALTNDHHAAEDLVAEALARTLPKWRTGTIDDPAPYVKQVLVNLASRRWRRNTLGRQRDGHSVEWTRPDVDAPTEIVERDATLRAIVALPPRRRAIVVLRYYDDLSLEQISELLGIKVGTVKSQLSRALEQLRGAFGGQEQ